VHPLKAVRGWVWRRLEPRIQGVVSQRLDPVAHRLAATATTAQEALAVAREARRLATDAVRVAEKLQKDIAFSRAMDEQLRAATAKAGDANRLAMEASRAIEQVLQAEVELWQAIDAKPGN
jgi:hypothetical protein